MQEGTDKELSNDRSRAIVITAIAVVLSFVGIYLVATGQSEHAADTGVQHIKAQIQDALYPKPR
ncbi:MAG: hypothetical protein JWL82_126 [Parcubacteria group bacterium]|nr:hypothetical protein [Parcubacteria group bacterium]